MQGNSQLPPGFRFHPTDEELIMFYLRNQATSNPCPVSIIPEVDIYKFDPWQLAEKAEFGENEWYFFTPRDRKYPNGVRPNRATVSGYWKATGTDKAIYSSSKYVGVKKALVFYKGRPPKGVKTDWIMHEYRLNDSRSHQINKHKGSMRLDDWVLCRIYKKKQVGRNVEEETSAANSSSQLDESAANFDANYQQHLLKIPNNCSFSHLMEMDYMSSISHLLVDNSYNPGSDFQSIMGNVGIENVENFQVGDVSQQYTDSVKVQANANPQMFYEFQ